MDTGSRKTSLAFVAEGVSGEGDAEFGYGADVAGVEFFDLDGLAALHDGEVGEAFGSWRLKFCDGGVGFDGAADDFEEGDAAGEGVGHGLEGVEGEGLAVVDAAHDDLVLPGLGVGVEGAVGRWCSLCRGRRRVRARWATGRRR